MMPQAWTEYTGSAADRSIEEILASFHTESVRIDLAQSRRIYLRVVGEDITSVDISFDDSDPANTSQQLLGYVLKTRDRGLEVRLKDILDEHGNHLNRLTCTIKDDDKERARRAYRAMERLYGGQHV